jgi:2-polyprenyl-6-methoxyphenol hydroxylase-like FAD-dependent oxidoreductase
MHVSTWTADVVVVGGRAAGAATAMLLARHGLRVLVVERGRYGADTLSTHALMRGGVLQLRRWGLLERIAAAGTPRVASATFTYADQRVIVPIKPAHGVDALYAPRRTVLDPILVDAAADAGAEIGYGIAVTDVLRRRDGRVRGVVGRDEHGDRVEVDAAVVVGADGLRSTIADRVGAGIERTGSGASAVVYGYWSDLATDGYEWAFRPGACTGVIPTNDGQACIFAATRRQRVGTGGIEVLRAIAAEADADVAARLAAGRAPQRTRTFPGRPGFVRRSWGPGWALVGDAGYWKDPLSAHGLTDALRDAELLARAIISSLGDGEEEERAALAEYQAIRDRLSADLFDVADVIAGQQWTADEIGGLLRRMSAAMSAEVEHLAALDAVMVE